MDSKWKDYFEKVGCSQQLDIYFKTSTFILLNVKVVSNNKETGQVGVERTEGPKTSRTFFFSDDVLMVTATTPR